MSCSFNGSMVEELATWLSTKLHVDRRLDSIKPKGVFQHQTIIEAVAMPSISILKHCPNTMSDSTSQCNITSK